MPLPIIGPLLDIASKVIDRVIPDKAAAEKAKSAMAAEIQKDDTQLLLQQIQVNLVEAANPSLFVSGWRPFVGWVCGAGLAYVAILEPIIRFFALVIFKYQGAFPVIDTSLTMQVLLGMLGLAGMRSFEKSKSVAAK